jgi:diaminopimelate decarboxylase
VRGSSTPPVSSYAQAIGEKIIALCGRLELPLPRLIVEPGRRIVGQAGVALYSVGSTKEIPGIRKYVSVDGGMGDNIRPALYEAVYEVLLANRAVELPVERVTVAGRFCESGDILAKDALLPPVAAGDIIAVPASGAYSPAMASNYNAFPRPAIVMVRDGEVRQIRRRETYQDLMKCDTP